MCCNRWRLHSLARGSAARAVMANEVRRPEPRDSERAGYAVPVTGQLPRTVIFVSFVSPEPASHRIASDPPYPPGFRIRRGSKVAAAAGDLTGKRRPEPHQRSVF